MSHISRRRLACSVPFVAMILSISACGPAHHPVRGKATVDGKPVTEGFVIFAPDKDNPLRQIARGKIEPSGDFVMTFNGADGVPAGAYKVALEIDIPKGKPGQKAPPLPVDQKYLDANTSPLTVQVPQGPYELKFEKPKG